MKWRREVCPRLLPSCVLCWRRSCLTCPRKGARVRRAHLPGHVSCVGSPRTAGSSPGFAGPATYQLLLAHPGSLSSSGSAAPAFAHHCVSPSLPSIGAPTVAVLVLLDPRTCVERSRRRRPGCSGEAACRALAQNWRSIESRCARAAFAAPALSALGSTRSRR